MVFRSKIDAYFATFLFIVILVIGGVTLIPLFIDKEATITIMLTMTSIFIVIISLILWSTFSIKYVFYQDHLFVKGGLFRSRIPYDKITKVSPTKAIFTGYRILSSKEGLEIFYQSATLGSLKVSPKESKLFISEIKKRCLNVKFQD